MQKNELDSMSQLIIGYLELLKNPKKVVGNMSYDEYCEWLEDGSLDDLLAARTVFEKENLTEHIKVIDIYIKKLQN